MTQMLEDDIARQRQRSVIASPQYEDFPRSGGAGAFVFQLASVADDMPAWGVNAALRDVALRAFWPTESMLASALYSTVIRNAAFSWTLEGPPRTVTQVQRIFHEADLGSGWVTFATKWLIDWFSQDNGAFIELIRAGQGEDAPVIGIANLDSGRCRRTGMPDFPVIYTSRYGKQHKLRPWQVIASAEFPSPIETMNGVGLCAVSRVLRMAQLARDISIYQREKVGGNNPSSMYLVNGTKASEISDAMEQHRERQEEKGLIRFMLPALVASLDPNANIDVKEIALAGLPENFDFEVFMKWYVTQIALGFGVDPQDIAPLPGGNLGTGAQSSILHLKARSKGPAMFIKTIEHLFNFHGVIPANVTFRFDEKDLDEDKQVAEVAKLEAESDQIRIASGVLTPAAVRQQMLDDGDISQEVFDALQEADDLTAATVAQDETRAATPGQRRAADGALGTPTTQQTQQDNTQNKAADLLPVETPSDFAEEDRREWEEEMADTMARALSASYGAIRRGLAVRKGLPLLSALVLGSKDDDALSFAEGMDTNAEWWREFQTRMVGDMLPFAHRIALGGAQYNATLGLPVNMDAVNADVLAYTRTYVDDWWREIETVTRSNMRQAMLTWQEVGLGERGLPDLVDALEPMFGRQRAERIAATEVTNLFDKGNQLAHIEAGIETEEFQTSRDEHVCPRCSPLNGKRFGVTEGPRPAIHVNCRCARLPIANNQAIRGH